MLFRIATTSLVIAIFSGSCAWGVGKNLARIMQPLTYAAFGIAMVLYIAGFIME